MNIRRKEESPRIPSSFKSSSWSFWHSSPFIEFYIAKLWGFKFSFFVVRAIFGPFDHYLLVFSSSLLTRRRMLSSSGEFTQKARRDWTRVDVEKSWRTRMLINSDGSVFGLGNGCHLFWCGHFKGEWYHDRWLGVEKFRVWVLSAYVCFMELPKVSTYIYYASVTVRAF